MSVHLEMSRPPGDGEIDEDDSLSSDQPMGWWITFFATLAVPATLIAVATRYWRRDALPDRRRPLDDPANDNFGITPAARKRAMDEATEHMAGRLLRADDLLAGDHLRELAETVTRGGGVVAWRRPDGTLEPYDPERHS
jgi:hypothetical protein